MYEVLFPRVSDSVVDKNPVRSGLSELYRSRTGSNLSDKKNVQAGMGNFIPKRDKNSNVLTKMHNSGSK